MRLLTPNFGGEISLIELLGIGGFPWAVQSTLGYDFTKTMRVFRKLYRGG